MSHQIISSLYKELQKDLADLNQMKSIVETSFTKELEIMESSDDIIRSEAFSYHNILTGKLEKYAFRDTTLEDLKRLTFWHQNSQYCWLLMSAYEKFKGFMNRAYIELTRESARDLKKCFHTFQAYFLKLKVQKTKTRLK